MTGKVTVDSVQMESLDVKYNDRRELEMTGRYNLMGSHGMPIAKQTFNGYNDVKYIPSPDAQKAMRDFLAAVQRDLNVQLGLA